MTNNNQIPIEVKKPVETVYELKEEYKIPSFEEFMKTYNADEKVSYDDLESFNVGNPKGYGPGNERKEQHLINTLNKHVGTFDKHDWWDEDISCKINNDTRAHNLTTSSGASVGAGGIIAGASASYSALRIGDNDNVDVRLGGASVGGEVGMGVGGLTAKAEIGIDAVNAKLGPGRVRIGANLDTGGSIGPGGVEVKAAGFGFSVGKKTGISTPLGEVAIDFDDCVVQ